MSYLTLQGGIADFSKAVISLWFRAPRESIIAASNNKVDSGLENFEMLQSILPLITLGKPQVSRTYSTPTHDVAVIHEYLPGEPSGVTYDTIDYVEGRSYDVDPSYIGLLCHSDGTFNMAFNLQMKNDMPLRATTHVTTQMDIYSGSDPGAPVAEADILGTGVVVLFPNVGVAAIADASYVDNAQPEVFTVITREDLEPDQWHHILLSFDVGGSISIGTPFASTSCKLWYAIDDRDYRGAENLGPYRNTGGQWGPDTLDANAILTKNAWLFSGLDPNWQAINYYQNHFVGLPQGIYGGGSIPSANAEIGLPASLKYVDAIFRCEMGEFQLFTDVTLDTGDEHNRRVFVDDEGKPVDPEGTEDEPAPAEKLLGKKPDILLHGSDDWIAGKNTGSLGIEINTDGEVVERPSGQFTPTAAIEPYKPDPALSEIPTA
jgi:hypothetical protein